MFFPGHLQLITGRSYRERLRRKSTFAGIFPFVFLLSLLLLLYICSDISGYNYPFAEINCLPVYFSRYIPVDKMDLL